MRRVGHDGIRLTALQHARAVEHACFDLVDVIELQAMLAKRGLENITAEHLLDHDALALQVAWRGDARPARDDHVGAIGVIGDKDDLRLLAGRAVDLDDVDERRGDCVDLAPLEAAARIIEAAELDEIDVEALEPEELADMREIERLVTRERIDGEAYLVVLADARNGPEKREIGGNRHDHDSHGHDCREDPSCMHRKHRHVLVRGHPGHQRGRLPWRALKAGKLCRCKCTCGLRQIGSAQLDPEGPAEAFGKDFETFRAGLGHERLVAAGKREDKRRRCEAHGAGLQDGW